MRCLRSLISAIGVLVFSAALIAQHPQKTPRITAPVDDSALVTLSGNTHPEARAEFDRGPVNADLEMGDLFLVLRRSPSQQKAFDDFVASQYDSSSPNYHHWLTPDEIGAQFGPSLADIDTISAWLRSHGLSVDQVSKDRMSIRFSGTAAEVQSAFHAPIHNLMVRNQPHVANMSDPQIPAALAPVVLGVKALHNFFPHPLSRIGGQVRKNPDTGNWEPIAPSSNVSANAAPKANLGTRLSPLFGSTSGGNQYEDVTPYDWATIYNVLPLWTASTPIDGTGQKVAIVGRSNINLSDVATFRSVFGLPPNVPQVIVTTNSDPGTCGSTPISSCTTDQVENTLDVEWSGAVAKNAKIILVTSDQATTTSDALDLSIQYAIDHTVAPIISVSYGLCELGLGTAGNTQYANTWRTAAAAGISVFVATGDSGSPACDQGGSAQYGTPYPAEFGLSVNGLASTPDNTAVGGTDLNWGSTASPYWNSTNDSNFSNAKGYMPEVPWNDSCTNPLILSGLQNIAAQIQSYGWGNPTNPTDAESACNFVVDWYNVIYQNTAPNNVDISWLVDTSGAGGGISGCTTNDGAYTTSCSGGYAQPSWQTGVAGIPSGGKRAIPDVSFFASNGFLGSAYLMCVTSAGSTCTDPTTFLGIGGTSAATPAMAGVMALVNQKLGGPQGNAAPIMYKLASRQTYSDCDSSTVTNSSACYFNDIKTGTISMPCDNGFNGYFSPDCTVANSSSQVGVTSGYDAGTAYDTATGLGSMNVANVVNGWASVLGLASHITVTPASSTLTSATSLAVTGAVTGSSGTPTGSVILSGAGYTSSSIPLDSAGKFSFTIPGYSFITGGSLTLTARYSGDNTYAASNGTAALTINLSTFSITATDVTLTPGSVTGNVSTITITPSNGYTGTVTLTAQLQSAPPNYVDPPTFTGSQVSITNTTAQQGTVAVVSTPVAAARTVKRLQSAWFSAAGGTALTALLLFCMPLGFRRGRKILSVLLLVVAAAFGFVGCGGGGSSSGGGGGGSTTPLVTISPTKATYATDENISVAVTVSGASTTATGSVTLTGGSYNSGARTLSNGGVSILIPASTFPAGSVTLNAAYSGDTHYNSVTNTSTITVQKTTPSVSVSSPRSTYSTLESIPVFISVSGAASTATGTITLSSGSYSSGALTLSNGSATTTIAAGAFTTPASITLTANYQGDNNYVAGNGTAPLTIAKAGTTSGQYTILVTATGNDPAATSATATFTLTVQ